MSGFSNLNRAPFALPQNIEIEQSLLGALLVYSEAYFKVYETVRPEDFYDPAHGRIYDAIATTIDSGRVADVRTLRAQFDADEALKSFGGGQYLVDLASSVISPINVEDYAKHVFELATRRRLISVCHEIQKDAFDQSAPPSSAEIIIANAEARFLYLAERRGIDGTTNLIDAWNKALAEIGEAMKGGRPLGLSTGLTDLDDKIGCFYPATLYTIAARPAMGKTAMALTIAINVVMSGGRVLFNTLEVSRNEIIERIIARKTGFTPKKLRKGDLTIEEYQKIFECTNEIAAWPLYIDDTPGLTLAQIRGRAIRQKRRYGLHLLIIDYLGLIKPSDPKVNRTYQIEEITRELKNLSKELNIPILVLAQLNRELEKRDDKRPIMSDLRDSGSIEQESDVIMFIYRHEHYLTRETPRRRSTETAERFADREERWHRELERSRNRAELIIQKVRQGEIGTVHLAYEAWRFHFFDIPNDNSTTNT